MGVCLKPITDRRWRLREPDAAAVALLEQEGISPLLSRLLANRGIGDAIAAKRHLSSALSDLHDPFLLSGMETAVDRLVEARQKQEMVCVYGDYDVDGITSVALLIDFFRSVAIPCCYHIPKRLEDGYGMSPDGVNAAASQGAKVIVTVDCGITALKEAELCRSKGIDLIITDHHMPPEEIPVAEAVINPLIASSLFPFRGLAGVGVAFNLVMALRIRLREIGLFDSNCEPNLRRCLDLVALGTVADLVPLIDENRIFVRHGLRQLTLSERPGIQALKTVAGIRGEVSCSDVGFRLAPRLNAVGRLEDASLGVELLLCNDPNEAATIASELDRNNAERQTVEREILGDALSMVKSDPSLKGRKSIVLASYDWHPGVIGIVASRIVDIYHRPTVLIAMQDGGGKGSGRSIPAFHLHDALNACAEHLLKFGGHKHAAGLAIEESTLEGFVEQFDRVAQGLLSSEDLLPELAIDAEISPSELSMELAEQIASLAPFGIGNPEPLLLLKGAIIEKRQLLKESHLKLQISANSRSFTAIGFNMADRAEMTGPIDLAVTPQVNRWNNRRTLQLRIKDIRPAC
jgi:single-stranded-DNA-specific exonuclease